MCLKNFNEFLCIYLGEGRVGVALMHVHELEHNVILSYRTNRWIFMKLGRDEVLLVPYKFCCFSARSAQGRIQGGAKIGHGVPSFNELLQTGRLQQQTECIAMIQKHVGWSVVIFGSIPKSNFWCVLTSFWT